MEVNWVQRMLNTESFLSIIDGATVADPIITKKRSVYKFDLYFEIVQWSWRTMYRFQKIILLPFVFLFFCLLEQSLLEPENNAGHSIVSGFRIAYHEVPSCEQLPRKRALVLLLGEFAQPRVLRHSEKISCLVDLPRSRQLLVIVVYLRNIATKL